MNGRTGLKLDDFAGTWELLRVIDDRRAGQVLRFEGAARFTARDGGLDYVETGRLVLPGAGPVQANRRYRWAVRDGQVEVFFDDGRFFHAFALSGAPRARHWCPPDDYAVCYDFGEWPVWSSRWSVNGPRKDYVARSVFRRA